MVAEVLMRESRANLYGLEVRVIRFIDTATLLEQSRVQVRRQGQSWGEAAPLEVVS